MLDAYRQAVTNANDHIQHPRSEPMPAARAEPAAPPQRHGARPRLGRRGSIDDYTTAELTDFVRWIESDDLVRTHDELLNETQRELGFARRGSKIVTAIDAAIKQARR